MVKNGIELAMILAEGGCRDEVDLIRFTPFWNRIRNIPQWFAPVMRR